MVCWANLRGGFVVGLIVLAVYAGADVVRLVAGDPVGAAGARSRLRTLLPIAGLTMLATLATPSGLSLLGHVTGYLGQHVLVDRTNEYRSPNFHQPEFVFFLVMLIATILTTSVS